MSSEHDLLIINGKIFDGTGSEPFNADIGINRDIITRIDSLESNNPWEIESPTIAEACECTGSSYSK